MYYNFTVTGAYFQVAVFLLVTKLLMQDLPILVSMRESDSLHASKQSTTFSRTISMTQVEISDDQSETFYDLNGGRILSVVGGK